MKNTILVHKVFKFRGMYSNLFNNMTFSQFKHWFDFNFLLNRLSHLNGYDGQNDLWQIGLAHTFPKWFRVFWCLRKFSSSILQRLPCGFFFRVRHSLYYLRRSCDKIIIISFCCSFCKTFNLFLKELMPKNWRR